MGEPSGGKYRSIIGKVVTDDAVPTHTMSFSRPVPLPKEIIGKGFDKQEEEKAVCDLRNISRGEVKKRYKISKAGFIASLLGVLFFVLADKQLPRVARLVMSAPFGVWISYYLSASQGI